MHYQSKIMYLSPHTLVRIWTYVLLLMRQRWYHCASSPWTDWLTVVGSVLGRQTPVLNTKPGSSPGASFLKQSRRLRGKLAPMRWACAYAASSRPRNVAFSSVGAYRKVGAYGKVGALQLPRRELTPTLVLKTCPLGPQGRNQERQSYDRELQRQRCNNLQYPE
jgi:hypothetical protein